MKRGMIFVRACDPAGTWGRADVLDLTDESFRQFVLYSLIHINEGFRSANDIPDGEIETDYRCVTSLAGPNKPQPEVPNKPEAEVPKK